MRARSEMEWNGRWSGELYSAAARDDRERQKGKGGKKKQNPKGMELLKILGLRVNR